MALTVHFDEPRTQTLALDNNNTNLPIESRTFARDGMAMVTGNFDCDASYPTGGYAVNLGLKAVGQVFIESQGGYIFAYNHSTGKIQAFDQTTTAGALPEVASATNLSSVTKVGFMACGRQY